MRIAFLVLWLSVAFAPEARATVVGCRDFRHGQVWLRHCVNHGYYPRHLDLSLPIEVEAMDELRRALVRAGAIEDRPLLVEVPPWPGFTSRAVAAIVRSDRCQPTGDDDERSAEKPLGACYLVDTTGLAPRWSTFQPLVVGLTTLTPGRTEREVHDLSALAREAGAAALAPVTVDGPITRSPGGGRRANVRFRDGRYDVVVSRGGAAVVHPAGAEPLHPQLRFSADGRRLAWATQGTLTLIEPTGQRRTLDLAKHFPGDLARNLIHLRFDGADAIEVTADRDLLNSFDVLRWSLPVDAAAIVERDLPTAPW